MSLAIFSDCGTYRLRLERVIPENPNGKTLGVCMVNPSEADAEKNDPTMNSVVRISRELGFGLTLVCNKFAYITPYVRLLGTAHDPIGPENDRHIRGVIEDCDVFVVAWGAITKLPTALRSRWVAIVEMANLARKPLRCFGVNGDGHPTHPLYLPASTTLKRWRPLNYYPVEQNKIWSEERDRLL